MKKRYSVLKSKLKDFIGNLLIFVTNINFLL